MKAVPSVLFSTGIALGGSAWFSQSLYQNYFYGVALFLGYLAWALASFNKKQVWKQMGRWNDQKKAIAGFGLCMLLGLFLLVYYESHMPKYEIALPETLSFKLPPHLSRKQLKSMGAECNTYGNTVCSQAVFARMVQLDPRDFLALGNLAMAQSHLGFHQQAIVNFERAIQMGAKRYDIYKLYGDSLLATRQKQQAMVAYSKSLLKNPRQSALRKRVKELSNLY